MLGWGGLRGAVGIAFALMVNADPELDSKYRDIVNIESFEDPSSDLLKKKISFYLIWLEQL